MTLKLATCCWLLLALSGSAALAQTHPKQKRTKSVLLKDAPVNSEPVTNQLNGHPPDWPGLDLSSEPGDTTKVYVYVEHMPLLNGQNAYSASSAAITQYLVVPPIALAGRVFVKFEVDRRGLVSHPKIVKGLRADVDSAVLRAVRQLPHFTPGRQGGRVVTVSITLPVTIPVKKQP